MSPSRRFGTSLASQLLRTPLPPSTTRTAFGRHCYHSYDHPPAVAVSYGSTEQAILSAAYTHVPQHGFSQRALALGAEDAGYPTISASVLPDGAFSLIRYHLVTRREELSGKTKTIFGEKNLGAQQLSTAARVEQLTWERLLGNKDVVHRWQEALAIMAQPSYMPSSLKELSLLADDIWFLAGDTSVDPSWYTKRASLATIYASSELFMTTDKSEGFFETRDFLRRRLEEVKQMGSVVGSVSQWLGFTANAGINVLRNKGLRI
ncbi:ubiquinone biosynthesis protein COQ9 [Sodiomyces alkalinus F11]|uniref:Ubiquinone biosynthesis protein n=1 Tax=Sodiomyces alkalinus (strain CBS 110278 / VKM F-3762 / F11) TaxID=1314773 RepID=A0A3N2Q7G1_SODAK|nr:ubiquinone biosynthesis protein COQ9 [Sodiomyces alkalinus F11]ROT42704.1 ubiquinone biosynthesis protein COQ9 [Sodiomyces alkalinus F11]